MFSVCSGSDSGVIVTVGPTAVGAIPVGDSAIPVVVGGCGPVSPPDRCGVAGVVKAVAEGAFATGGRSFFWA